MEAPYRLSLAGGWIDQPFVSRIRPGSMVNLSIEPDDFMKRSGMATSTRATIETVWKNIPDFNEDPLKYSKILFAVENPPGTKDISGSQDSIGIVYPGIKRLDYNGEYWPEKITYTTETHISDWLEEVIHLIPLWPRPYGYDPLKDFNSDLNVIKNLGRSGNICWESINEMDVSDLQFSLELCMDCWRKMLPRVTNDEIEAKLEEYPGLLTGAGGGGYIICASDEPILGALKIKVRR